MCQVTAQHASLISPHRTILGLSQGLYDFISRQTSFFNRYVSIHFL